MYTHKKVTEQSISFGTKSSRSCVRSDFEQRSSTPIRLAQVAGLGQCVGLPTPSTVSWYCARMEKAGATVTAFD